MALTEKKRVTNNRYLAKFKTRSIRFQAEDDEKLQRAAAAAGQSPAAYTVQAVLERMDRDAARGADNAG